MAYNKKIIFEQAKALILEKKLFFIEDIVALLPCDKTTFYRLFKTDSNEYNELKELLDAEKINIKVSLRKKWFVSDSPALQMALMKLLATSEELKKLSMQYIESENTNVNKNFDIKNIYGKETQEDLEQLSE
jgi:hypothetical protein